MNILYLVHRLPYPPNKGDKVRSYHLLKHLSRRHKVYLGTFIDDPEDEVYLDEVKAYCADQCVLSLSPSKAKVASLTGLVTDEALSLPYYHSRALKAWVDKLLAAGGIDACIVFSSPMAQYVPAASGLPMLVDFVDVDSNKWSLYASRHRWPMSWVYAREARRLLEFERDTAMRAAQSFFVTLQEVDLFCQLSGVGAGKVSPILNGVNSDYFDPKTSFESPFAQDEIPLVFTGAMDYWPNIDAVVWFVQEMLPALKARFPSVRFHIVGRSPSPEVQALANGDVNVTGTVPDVRPYLQHARIIVAPLRVARGVQNKILEAMAMAKPVVAAKPCVDVLGVRQGTDILAAESASDYIEEISRLLNAPETASSVGIEARQAVVDQYSWDAHLSVIDQWLEKSRTGLPS